MNIRVVVADDHTIIRSGLRMLLEREAGFEVVDYVAIRDAETLEPIENLDRPARILVAAWLGKTRLIDNMEV